MTNLYKIIASTLQITKVDPTDSPIDLGIDSIIAVEITSMLGKQGVDIDAGLFFEVDSIGEIEQHIDKNSNNVDYSTLLENNERETESTIVDTLINNNSDSVTEQIQPDRLEIPDREFYRTFKELKPSHVYKPTLPSSLTDSENDQPLGKVIDRLSKYDRTLIANNDYFYEPVIEKFEYSWARYNQHWYLNMASYSYLGLIDHPFIVQAAIDAIAQFGTGAHGVRLLSGTTTLHRQLENVIANFLHDEDALVFSSGYMANVATISSLVDSEDIVISDMFNHASIVDGCRLSCAKFERYRHNDMNDLERILKNSMRNTRTRLVISDAVFSMDGDIADLPSLIQLCQRYDAILMIDEAHSLGVLGKTGRGICEYYNVNPKYVDIKMGTLSKTIPSTGGYVCGSRDLIFSLKNNARGWMFSAAISPSQAATAIAAIEVIKKEPALILQLQEKIQFYRNLITSENLSTLGKNTPIVPIMTENDADAISYARTSQNKGLFVQPITYPTVSRNMPRVRTIVTLNHTFEDLRKAATILKYAITTSK